MEVNRTEYLQKLMSYSKSTVQLITDFGNTVEKLRLGHKIVMESKTEEEVVSKLNQLDTTMKQIY